MHVQELALLTGARRAMSVRTAPRTFVDLFVLRRSDFDSVLAMHPDLRRRLLDKVKGFLTTGVYTAAHASTQQGGNNNGS